MPREWCRTIAEALDTIRTMDELRGFVATIKDQTKKTKAITEADKARINEMHARFLREAKR